MISKDNDQNSSWETVFDLDKSEALKLNESQMTVFHVFKKRGQPVFMNDTVRQYMDIRFVRVKYDFYQADPKDVIDKSETIEARNCIKRDFSSEEHAKKILSDWAGFSLICPKLDDEDQSISLSGNAASMESQSLQFEISGCNNNTVFENKLLKCKSKE